MLVSRFIGNYLGPWQYREKRGWKDAERDSSRGLVLRFYYFHRQDVLLVVSGLILLPWYFVSGHNRGLMDTFIRLPGVLGLL